MYRHLYGLKDKPFQISTDPTFLWLGGKHKEALAVLVYGVRSSKGFLLLSGGVGTGKTTLIRSLLGQLDKKVAVATVHDPGLTPLDFFNFIAAAYGMRKRYTNKVDFLFDFEKFLRKTRAEGRTALLIVDEAQRLDQTLLEEIRLLSNIEDPDQKLLNVFFVGQEEFLDIISDPQNRALKQRITINYHLATLSMEETEQLVRHRLKVAGATREVFTPDAFPGIFAFSLGAPRLINILCDHALLTGFVHNVDTIGADIIAECTQDLMLPGEDTPGQQTNPPATVAVPATDPKPTAATVTAGMMLQNTPPPPKRRIWPWAAAALLLITIGVGFLWQQGWQPLTKALNLARVTPSVPAEKTTPEDTTTPEPTTPSQPEAPEQPMPAPTAPAASLPVPPQTTSTAEDGDGTEANEAPSTPAEPDRIADMNVRHDDGDGAPRPDSLPPQPLPETPEAESLIGQEVPDPIPPEDIAALNPVDQTTTGSNHEAPSAPAPDVRVETKPRMSDPGAFKQTDDGLTPPLPPSPATVPLEATEVVVDGAAPVPKETPPDAVPPVTAPPAAPAKATRPEPEGPDQSPLAALPKPASSEATTLVPELPTDVDMTAPAAPPTPPAPLPPYTTEDKIRDFIRSYRKAYESLDIDRFRLFFTEDAMELNRPLSAALPVYQRNFNVLSALEYDITLQSWEEDEATGQVSLEGIFDIRYRMPESAWRNTRGDIRMDLVETGGVYRIKRLDYWKK
jgi:general secretion pathway protein A